MSNVYGGFVDRGPFAKPRSAHEALQAESTEIPVWLQAESTEIPVSCRCALATIAQGSGHLATSGFHRGPERIKEQTPMNGGVMYS